MPIPIIAKGPSEYSRVGTETEIKIPRSTYIHLCVLLMGVDTGIWAIGALLWLRVRIKAVGFARWWSGEWARWFSVAWIWYAISLILCWIGPSALAYAYSLVLELVAKTRPLYENMSPDDGIWNPFGRRRDGNEPEQEMEASAQTVDLNLWDKGPDKKQPRMRKLPDFLVSAQARMFYRAVASGSASFSQREARRYGISRREFNRNVRDALLTRGMATLKDDKHPNLGVDLSGDALRTLELLGRSPLPRKSA